MTSAKRMGVRSGTRIARGVCALKAKRRPERVEKARHLLAGRAWGSGRAWLPAEVVVPDVVVPDVVVVMSLIPFSGGGQPAPGQTQVHVIEGRRPGRGLLHACSEVSDRVDN